MRKTRLFLGFMLTMLLAMNISLMAQTADPPASGDGTAGNPYQIATLNNLYWISQNSGEWDKHYIQTADIDASETSTWNSGEGFSPIGNVSTKFTGSYDGNNHTIDGLYINRPGVYDPEEEVTVGGDFISLFGYTKGVVIKDLGATNVNFTGRNTVSGLVGKMYNSSTVISNSYSRGNVSGNSVGGLISNSSGTVNNSFWDTQTSGQSSSGNGTGKTTMEMKTANTYTNIKEVNDESNKKYVGICYRGYPSDSGAVVCRSNHC